MDVYMHFLVRKKTCKQKEAFIYLFLNILFVFFTYFCELKVGKIDIKTNIFAYMMHNK